MPYRYKDVELALAETFSVKARDMPAFRARLRHLRNLGVPSITGSGKGVAIAYDREHVIEVLLALELELLGFSPAQAARISPAFSRHKLAEIEEATARGRTFYVRAVPGFSSKDDAYVTIVAPGMPPANQGEHRVIAIDVAGSIKRLDLHLSHPGLGVLELLPPDSS